MQNSIKIPRSILAGLMAAGIGFVAGFFVRGFSDNHSVYGLQPFSIGLLIGNLILAVVCFITVSLLWQLFCRKKLEISLLRGTLVGALSGFLIPAVYIILLLLMSLPADFWSTLFLMVVFTQMLFGLFGATVGAAGGFLFTWVLRHSTMCAANFEK